MDIVGSGGRRRRQQNRTPTEAPDSLQSRATASILDLLGEGEIEGLINGAKSIFFDNTPLQNPDNTFNFDGVIVDYRNGTQAQPLLAFGLANDVRTEINVNVEISSALGSIVRTLSDPDASAVLIRVGIPSLFRQLDNGDIVGNAVTLKIEVQASGAAYRTVIEDTIRGKNISLYERQYRIGLSGASPWNIRLTKLTPDSTTTKLANTINWSTFTEVKTIKLTYPNSAIVGISFDSSNFSSVPRRTYLIKGRKIKIPSNALVDQRDGGLDYTGGWNGAFVTSWCADPAWILYDVITNTRFGAGEYIEAEDLDKFAFYQASLYCNESISDGLGGFERRFLCNVYIRSRREAFDLINQLVSVFRGSLYWTGAAVVPFVDKPVTTGVAKIFNQANVIDGEFTYSSSSRRARHSLALVNWADASNNYAPTVEPVYDNVGIKEFGVREIRIDAFGATSRGQAFRAGKAILSSERLETETVTFRVAAEGNTIFYGDLIQIRDSFRDGVRFGGRIKSATRTTVVLDNQVTLDSGKVYTMYCVNSDGVLERRDFSTVTPTINTINSFSQAFSSEPIDGSAWIITDPTTSIKNYRVISIVEADGDASGEVIFEVTALLYQPGKYIEIDNSVFLNGRFFPQIPNDVLPPFNVVAGYFFSSKNGIDFYNLQASWGFPIRDGIFDPFVLLFDVEFKKVSDELWRDRRTTRLTSVFFEDLPPDSYKVRVRTVDNLGRISAWVESPFAIDMNQTGGNLIVVAPLAAFGAIGTLSIESILSFIAPAAIFSSSGNVFSFGTLSAIAPAATFSSSGDVLSFGTLSAIAPAATFSSSGDVL